MRKFSWTRTVSSRRTLRSRRVIYTLAITAALILCVWLLPRAFSFVTSIVIAPAIAIENWLGESTSAIPSYIRDRSEMIEREKQLEQALVEAQTSELEREDLESENSLLRSLLGASSTPRIAAGVIGRPTELPYDVLVIDKGASDGIRLNAPVYAGKEHVIGFVAEAHINSSVVVLTTTPGFRSTVYIYGPNIYTTALGIGGGTLRVSVPQGIDLTVGNTVIIPALDTGVYGTVSVVDSSPTRPEQYGYVSMDIPLQSLHFVSVGEDPLSVMSFEEAKAVVDRARREFLEVEVPQGILVDIPEKGTASSSATTTATST